MMKNGSLDTALRLQLPWPADLQIIPAGPFLRFFAMLIDHIMMVLIFILVSLLAVLISVPLKIDAAKGIVLFVYFVALFVVYNGYFFLSEWLMKGQTPGKMVCGLRVLQLDGSEADVWALLIRNLLRPGDMFPYLTGIWVFYLPTYLLAGITSALVPHFRRLGDLAAGTTVVYDRSPLLGLLRRQELPMNTGTTKIYALRRVDPVLYEAVARYMSRRESISAARREEIALSCYEDLRQIFAWTGPDPTPEELMERIHRFRMQGS